MLIETQISQILADGHAEPAAFFSRPIILRPSAQSAFQLLQYGVKLQIDRGFHG